MCNYYNTLPVYLCLLNYLPFIYLFPSIRTYFIIYFVFKTIFNTYLSIYYVSKIYFKFNHINICLNT